MIAVPELTASAIDANSLKKIGFRAQFPLDAIASTYKCMKLSLFIGPDHKTNNEDPPANGVTYQGAKNLIRLTVIE